MNKRWFAGWLAGVAAFVASGACAQDAIKVNPVVPYASSSVGSPDMQKECNWNRLIVEHLVAYSKGMVEVTEEDLDKVSGKVARMVITNAHSAGGGGFSGPKWGYINVTLSENGAVISEFEVGSRTAGGGWNACGALEGIAKQIGARTAKLLRKPPKPKAAARSE